MTIFVPEILTLADEFEYLRWAIHERYFAESDRLRVPLMRQIYAAIALQNWAEVERLEQEDLAIASSLVENRLRSLDILRWLKTDRELRQESKTYADVLER